MKIDETNISIIKHLRDGRKSYSSIAEELSITENTVRSRVNKLVEEKVLEISGLVDPESLPGHKLVLIGIKLNTMELERKARELKIQEVETYVVYQGINLRVPYIL